MTSDGIEAEIARLKRERNAVIMAHNYQVGEVQDIADFTGDSLELSRLAARTDADVIVFCGVHFMAETAAILSPEKTVLLPEEDAGCPMANMIDAEGLRRLRAEHPDALVVCYVNTTAEVKAESDYCCTSANAENVVKRLPESKEIIFVPDKYLGQYVAGRTGREMILWNGYCPTHVCIMDSHVRALKAEHPDAVAMAHPECTAPVRDAADLVLSTGGMVRAAAESEKKEFIVATEPGIIHRLQKENPGKVFYPASERAICPNMKKISLASVLAALKEMRYVIKVPEDVRVRALRAIERMLEVTA